jgi:hypothetical protein
LFRVFPDEVLGSLQSAAMVNFPSAEIRRPSTRQERWLHTVAAVAVAAFALFLLR